MSTTTVLYKLVTHKQYTYLYHKQHHGLLYKCVCIGDAQQHKQINRVSGFLLVNSSVLIKFNCVV